MEIKDRIKHKADDLFRRYGIRNITMDEIAGQMGISKKTIYLYYADKDELVDEVITDMLQFNQLRCDSDREIAVNAIHEIFLAMEMIKEMFENMNPSILYDLEKNHPNTFARFLEHKNKYLLQILKDNIERGIKQKLYRPEVNADIVARIRLETMFLPFNQEIFPKNKFRLAEVERHLIEYYLFGIASLKGYELILKYQKEQEKKAHSK
ncbi:MAG: TetR/AcrR family transcriptional regulator [Chitinophagaceae bacterium]|nr:TetR/AcrR family transcriptional regulator [Chitinophagaceae bacterium]